MATKKELAQDEAVRQGFGDRLEQLIEKADGVAGFCRTVWPRDQDPVAMNKSKVSKWQRGTLIDPIQAARVARAFGYRAGWLLYGELPEKETVARTLVDLADDVKAEVMARVELESSGTRLKWIVERGIAGEHLLKVLTETVLTELRANNEWVYRTAALGTAIERLQELDDSRLWPLIDELESLRKTAPPVGSVIQWGKTVWYEKSRGARMKLTSGNMPWLGFMNEHLVQLNASPEERPDDE